MTSKNIHLRLASSQNHLEERQEQGFKIYALKNEQVEVAVAPELGAKIISLKNIQTGREWLWHPAHELKLFKNRVGDDFSKSTLVGWDECLPTIAPCSWRSRALPDHGEIWAAACNMDAAAWKQGVLKTSLQLPISPFGFERTLELQGGEIILTYQLINLSDDAECYLWAMHPLLRLRPGDALDLPASTRSLVCAHKWIDAVDSSVPVGNCAKIYARPLREGRAGISNRLTGDFLHFKWNPAENRTLGLWLTRGGWHGHHHFALEPANGASDVLARATEEQNCGVIGPRESANWGVRLIIGCSSNAGQQSA